MLKLLFALSILSCLTYYTDADFKIDLTRYDWKISDETGKYNIVSKVPTDIYLSLFQSYQIPDPYYEDNDEKLRNLSYVAWNFTTSFKLPTIPTGVKLIAESVDTISAIFFNGHQIGSTSNMFVAYRFEIPTEILRKDSNNELTFQFQPPVPMAKHLAKWHIEKYGYDIPPLCPPPIQNGMCNINMLRKMQSSFSWDWGPGFATMGIYRGVYIYGYNQCIFERFSAVPRSVGLEWDLQTEFQLHCKSSVQKVQFIVSIKALNFNVIFENDVVPNTNLIHKTFTIRNKDIILWHPNGNGLQKVYQVDSAVSIGLNLIANKTLQTGFRKVELIQDPIISANQTGLSFYFTVNGVKTFLKGANWIPADSFQPRITKDTLRFYFKSMKDANMNALRVWGGGVYETDEFYDLADEFGIAIWQDMMFAVSLYPGHNVFLDNVRNETNHQVNRLKHHPSIIVWAGNNENEQGMASGWFGSSLANHTTFMKDYKKLYWDTIHDEITKIDNSDRPYLVSSPSNGKNGSEGGNISGQPNDPRFGDIHFYSYIDDLWDPKTYQIPRCVTEYGFQSLPSVSTFLKSIDQSHLSYRNPSILHRQHNPLGHAAMINYISLQFAIKKCKLIDSSKVFDLSLCKNDEDTEIPFADIVYLTQIYQAVAYKTQTEHYRRWRSRIDSNGQGFTMCALYWQLNDIWPGISWSTIDFSKKWKMAQYYAREFFKPILISPVLEKNNLEVFLVSDSTEDLFNLTLTIDMYVFDRFGKLYTETKPVGILPKLSSNQISIYNVTKIKQSIVDDPEILFLFFHLSISNADGNVLSENTIFPANAFLTYPTNVYGKVTIKKVTRLADLKYSILLFTTKPAAFVSLEAENVTGWFSENGFMMFTPKKIVEFHCYNTDNCENGNFSVMSLRDVLDHTV